MSKIALLFPGQGSQYIGMGKALCEKFSTARETFEEANQALGFDLRALCLEGDMGELTKTENTQPAILTASVAAFRVYMQETGVEPAFCAGHSLGEFSALTCAGAMSFADGVKIVRQRGKFMQESAALGEGAMAAISGVDKLIIEEECMRVSREGNIVVVSNYNSPEQTVISGHCKAVEAVSGSLKEKGARVVPLKVSAPFHSPLMKPAADKLKEELGNYTYGQLKYPVISNVTAQTYRHSGEIIEKLTMQIVQPVQWTASMEYLRKQDVEIAIEMGPQTVLKNLMKKNAPTIKTYAYDKEDDVKSLEREITLKPEENKGFPHTVISKCIAAAVCTRNRNWDRDEYQKGVVEPYRRIQKMQEQLESEGKKPDIRQMKEALEMLKSVFETKKVPVEEQIERFNEIFDTTGTRSLFPDFDMPV